MNDTKWLKLFLLFFGSLCGLLVLSNFVIDPMMTLPFSHKFNQRVLFVNERQQKTNQFFFENYYGKPQFDGLLLGSSRSIGINPNTFAPHKVFNYAVSGSNPKEALAAIKFYKKITHKDPQLIVLGLDFMGAADSNGPGFFTGDSLTFFTQEILKPFHTIANLLSLKAFPLSLRIFRHNLHPRKPAYYFRDQHTMLQEHATPEDERARAFDAMMTAYQGIYGTYHYDAQYKSLLQQIRNQAPNARFIVYTTPVSEPMLKLLCEKGLVSTYKQWLTDISSVFNPFYQFMDINPVTQNYVPYFDDSHHLNVASAQLLADVIAEKNNPSIPPGFGKKLTPQNLPAYLATIQF